MLVSIMSRKIMEGGLAASKLFLTSSCMCGGSSLKFINNNLID